MSFFAPDPRELHARAARIAQQAQVLRAEAVRIGVLVAITRWRSPAATAFRSKAHDLATALINCADQVEVAADLMRLHAGRIATEAARPGGSS